jgi:uncharacterized repeat protein (TIGR01451 family)
VVDTNISLTSLTLTSGELDGSSIVSLTTGRLTWTGGTIAMAGPLSTGQLVSSGTGTGPWTLNGTLLQVSGTTNWGTTGTFNLANSATLSLAGTGTFSGTGQPLTFSGPGTVNLSALTINPTSTIAFNGGATVAWTGVGSGGGTVTIGQTGTLSFVTGSGSGWDLSGVTLQMIASPSAWPDPLSVTAGGRLDLQTQTSPSFANLTLNGGTLSGSDPVTITNQLTLNNGTLSNAGGASIATLSWSSGAISGGPVTVNSELDLYTSGTKTLNGSSLTAATTNWNSNGTGQVTLTGSTLSLTASPLVTIYGPIAVSDAGSSLNLNGGAFTLARGAALTGLGTVTVDGNGLTCASQQAVTVRSLTLNSGTLDGTDTFNLGTLTLTGGTWNGSNDVSASTLALQGGTLSGTGSLFVHTFTWDGGAITGTGSLNVDTTFNLNLDTTVAPAMLAGRTVNVTHQFNQPKGPANLGLGSGAAIYFSTTGGKTDLGDVTLYNGSIGGTDAITTHTLTWQQGTIGAQPGGAVHVGGLTFACAGPWTLQNVSLDATTVAWPCTSSSNPFTLTNSSFIDRGGGTNPQIIAPPIVLTGSSLDFEAATQDLTLSGGVTGTGSVTFNLNSANTATVSGPFNLDSSSTTTLTQGALSFSSGASLGILNWSGGSIAGSGSIVVSGPLTWSGGSFSGSGNLYANGGLTYASGATHSLTGGHMIVGAITAWTGLGALTVSSATLDLTAPSSPAPAVEINGPILANTGRLNLYGGTFDLNGGLSGAGDVIVESPATVNFNWCTATNPPSLRSVMVLPNATLRLQSGCTVSTGSLSVDTNGNLTGTDDIQVSGSMHWFGGSLAGTGSQAPRIEVPYLYINRQGTTDPPRAWQLEQRHLQVDKRILFQPLAGDGPLTIANNGTLDILASAETDQNDLAGPIILSGGTLTGSADLELKSTLIWQSGTIGGGTGSRPTITVDGLLALPGSGAWTLQNRTLTMSPSSAWNSPSGGTLSVDDSDLTLLGGTGTTLGGAILLANGSRLAFDQGSFNISTSLSGDGSVDFGPANSTTVVFTGRYTYSLSTGSSTFSNGSVTFSTSTGGAPLNLGSRATIAGAAVQMDVDCDMGSGSQLNLAGGSLTGSGNVTVQDFNWSGGSLSGAGSLSVTTLNFTASKTVQLNSRSLSVGSGTTWTGAGTLTILGNGALGFTGGSSAATGSLILQAGTISSSIPVTLGTNLDWQSGALIGPGKFTVPGGAALTLSTAGSRTLDGAGLDLAGSAAWTGSGSLTLANSAALNILPAGTLTLSGSDDVSIAPANSGAGTFSNAGSLVVQQNAKSASIGLAFNSPGAIHLASGTLLLNGDVDGTGSGTLRVQGGTLSGTGNITGMASLDWTGGAITASSGSPTLVTGSLTSSGAGGTWTLSGRDLTAASTAWAGTGTVTLDASTLELIGSAAFSGSGTTVFSGAGELRFDAGLAQTGASGELDFQNGADLAWAGGTLSGGVIRILSGSSPANLSFGGGGPWVLDGAALHVNGNATWPSGGQQIQATHLAVLDLSTGNSQSLDSLLLDQATLTGTDTVTLSGLEWHSGTISAPSGSVAIQVTSLTVPAPSPSTSTGPWTLTHRALTVTSIVGWDPVATGTVSLTASQLALSAGPNPVTIPTAFSLDAPSVLEFDQGTLTLNGDLSGAGSLQVGTATSSPKVTFIGTVNVGMVTVGGGTAILTSGATVSIPTLNVSAGSLGGSDAINATSLTWTGGAITGGGGVTADTLSISGSGPWMLDGRSLTATTGAAWSGAGTLTLANAAAITLKGPGTLSGGGTTTFTGSGSLTVNAGLSQTGVGGALVFQDGAGLVWAGGALSGGVLTIDRPAAPALPGSLSFSGSGPWVLDGATLHVNGTAAWPTQPTAGQPAIGPIQVTNQGMLDISTGVSQSIDQLVLAGGALQGTDNLAIATNMDWSSGAVSGTGGLSFPSGATLSLTGSGERYLTTRQVTVSGSLNWTGAGVLHLYDQAVLKIQGQVNFQSGSPVAIDLKKNPTDTRTGLRPIGSIQNTGTLNQLGSGGLEIDVTITSPGAVNVTNGTLTLSPPDTGTLNGPVAVTGGALTFNSGAFTLGSGVDLSGSGAVTFGAVQSAQVAGTVNLTGTTTFNSSISTAVTFTGSLTSLGNPVVLAGRSILELNTGQPVTLTNLRLQSGTLAGSDPVTVTGKLDWSGGTLGGDSTLNPPAALTLPAGSQFNYLGTADRVLANRDLQADCPTTWSGTGTLNFQGSAVLENTGELTVHQPTGSLLMAADPGAPVFINRGTVRLQIGAGQTTILGAPTANTGTFELQSGTLNISQDYFQTAGLLKLDGGALLVTNPRTGQTLQLDGGRLEALGNSATRWNSTISGNLQNNKGEIDLGDTGSPREPGVLTITGNFTQGPGGTLGIYLAGPGSADRIDVGGTATLDGTLNTVLLLGYAPKMNDQATIMTYGNAVGSFTQLPDSDLGGGLYLLPDYASPTELDLKVTNVRADLDISLKADVDPVAPGETLTFTILITNRDAYNPVDQVLVTDVLPAQIANATWTCQASAGGACTGSSGGTGDVSQYVALAPGGTATITVVCTVAPGARGTFSNTTRVNVAGITNKADLLVTIHGARQPGDVYLPLVVR